MHEAVPGISEFFWHTHHRVCVVASAVLRLGCNCSRANEYQCCQHARPTISQNTSTQPNSIRSASRRDLLHIQHRQGPAAHNYSGVPTWIVHRVSFWLLGSAAPRIEPAVHSRQFPQPVNSDRPFDLGRSGEPVSRDQREVRGGFGMGNPAYAKVIVAVRGVRVTAAYSTSPSHRTAAHRHSGYKE
jgi:hypothetical protein